jgi:phosphatidylglycerophosphatase A
MSDKKNILLNLSLVDLLRQPVHFLAFGLGSGLSAKAPGTVGTLAAIPFAYGLLQLSPVLQLSIIAAAFVLGIYLCEKTASDLGVNDYGGIVWDEFVGYWIAVCAFPLSWQTMLAGFLLFRIFDVLKPWPISWLDKKIHGGLGIMLDDVLAGIFSWLGVFLFYYFMAQ